MLMSLDENNLADHLEKSEQVLKEILFQTQSKKKLATDQIAAIKNEIQKETLQMVNMLFEYQSQLYDQTECIGIEIASDIDKIVQKQMLYRAQLKASKSLFNSTFIMDEQELEKIQNNTNAIKQDITDLKRELSQINSNDHYFKSNEIFRKHLFLKQILVNYFLYFYFFQNKFLFHFFIFQLTQTPKTAEAYCQTIAQEEPAIKNENNEMMFCDPFCPVVSLNLLQDNSQETGIYIVKNYNLSFNSYNYLVIFC